MHGKCLSHDVASLEPLLDMAAEMNAAVNDWRSHAFDCPGGGTGGQQLSMARAYDFPLLMETHRNGTLNDLFYTLEVLEMVPELRLCRTLSST